MVAVMVAGACVARAPLTLLRTRCVPRRALRCGARLGADDMCVAAAAGCNGAEVGAASDAAGCGGLCGVRVKGGWG